MSTEPQPSVIQWNKVHIDPSRVACSSNVEDTMRDPKEESERTIVIPFNKNTKFSSQDPEYLDVKIEVLSDSKSGFDDTDADPNTEYLNVRIEVEPNPSIETSSLSRYHNNKRFHISDTKLLSTDILSSPGNTPFERTDPSPTIISKPFKCDSCSKSFATKQHLERHSNLHTKETLYPCPECDKVLLDKSYLLRHMRVHAELKPFTCNICQKKFRTACSLKRHETTHDPSSRPYVCPDCDKRFPDRSSLKKHSRIHAGVKTHVCIICAKGFCHVGDYNLHLKGHDIVKQYHCDQCGKEFARHNNLLRHKAVHSAGSNFQCVICKGCFQHASTLTRHILSCHPEAARVKKKKSRHADSQASGNLPSESISHENGVSDHASANVELNSSENELPPQAKIVPFLNSSNYVSNIDKGIAIGLDRCAGNVHDAASVDLTSNPPNALSPSSFEIYQFDAHGTLVKMTDNLSF